MKYDMVITRHESRADVVSCERHADARREEARAPARGRLRVRPEQPWAEGAEGAEEGQMNPKTALVLALQRERHHWATWVDRLPEVDSPETAMAILHGIDRVPPCAELAMYIEHLLSWLKQPAESAETTIEVWGMWCRWGIAMITLRREDLDELALCKPRTLINSRGGRVREETYLGAVRPVDFHTNTNELLVCTRAEIVSQPWTQEPSCAREDRTCYQCAASRDLLGKWDGRLRWEPVVLDKRFGFPFYRGRVAAFEPPKGGQEMQ